MFLNVDNVGAERKCSGRLYSKRPGQSHKMPGYRVVALSWYDLITTSSGTESSKVGNSRN